jgi:ketosteroid isomerase-like protein
MKNSILTISVILVVLGSAQAYGLNPYHSIIKGKVKASFEMVNNHQYDELLKGISDKEIEHSFAGDHSLGGKRHDKINLKKWFERLGTTMPDLKLEITDIQVKGGPSNTLVIARWTATNVLLNGESYVNKGVHFITLKWGKAVKFDVYEDTKVVSHGLDVQYEAGIKEAKAPKIES